MKLKTNRQKLTLHKVTVSNLNYQEMRMLYAGGCPPPTAEPCPTGIPEAILASSSCPSAQTCN